MPASHVLVGVGAGPEAAGADEGVVLAVHDPLVVDALDPGAVVVLEAGEAVLAGVGVTVEVDEADVVVVVGLGPALDVGVADGVVATDDDGRRLFADLVDGVLDVELALPGVARRDRRVARVRDLEVVEGVDARLDVEVLVGRRRDRRGRADGPGAVAGTRPDRRRRVQRCAEDTDVDVLVVEFVAVGLGELQERRDAAEDRFVRFLVLLAVDVLTGAFV